MPIAALAVSVTVLVTTPERQFLHPFGWWTVLVYLGVGVVPLFLYLLLFSTLGYMWTEIDPSPSANSQDSGNVVIAFFDNYDFLSFVVIFILIPFAFSIAFIPLAEGSFISYLLCGIGCGIIFWITDINLFLRGRHRYYIYRPNKYVDMYEDPKSLHWVANSPGRGSRR